MTPKVQYAYADGSANHIRPTGMTYPNGRAIGYGYGASGGMDDGLSRLAAISDGGASRASFKYLGLSTPVRTELAEPGICHDLWGGTPGQYDGLDPFLRVKDLRWTGSGGDRVRIKHGYDRDSNRLWRENPVAAATTHPQDQLYAYDRLNRLIQMQRGLLNAPHTGLTQKDFEQAWGLDKAGNWSRFDQQVNTPDGVSFDQTRRTNKGNEIVGVGTQSGPAWAAPAYDPTGNMRSFPKPANPTGSFGAKYDAWNRLVKVTDGEATVAEYAYDGRSFRTRKKTYESGLLAEERDFYYSSAWQVLEEPVGSNVERQNVWGLGINSLILRDRDSDGDGVIDERLYALQDAHWDVCAVADAAGNVLERYEYEAYGKPRILTPDFEDRGVSDYDWEVLFQGSARDAESGLYQVRYRYYNPALGLWITRDPLFDHWQGHMLGGGPDYGHRFYSPSLGRFLSRDPVQETGGVNLYVIAGNSLVLRYDPLGLQTDQPEPPNYPYDLRFSALLSRAGECGDYTVVQGMNLSPGPQTAGSYIQLIKMEVHAYDCDTLRKSEFPTRHQYEAKEVPAGGDAFVGDVWDGVGPLENTFGSVTVNADLAFYGVYTLNFPPWQMDDGLGIPIIPVPGVNPGLPAPSSNTIGRELVAIWNCCCDSEDRTTTLLFSVDGTLW